MCVCVCVCVCSLAHCLASRGFGILRDNPCTPLSYLLVRRFVTEYAKDQDKFFADFAKAFSQLLELGVEFPSPASA